MGDKRDKVVFVYMGKSKGYLKVRLFKKRKEEDPGRVVILGRVSQPLPGYQVLKLDDFEAVVREKLENA
ncbi:DUF5622 domain-containing protein [Acidilobus sp. 7A]|uniref:DUF5622 domain-containing protein n=1 Tax=Acidilobus sp. 7A TaxID=1577685 RepID=UPI000764E13F|nr:DUF5622 domain-containing protein [Acidilobus sp. 7A]AMD31070.1 hypothetical protein SE86_07265 [Acidilobus sp. 7A]